MKKYKVYYWLGSMIVVRVISAVSVADAVRVFNARVGNRTITKIEEIRK